ncbi:N-acetylhexosaminidase [Exidia glandulosa HHB12029]|uniref:Beta-hexosaminidase n=1 Tax=Exidia glandulosa HHB12029 TaxID=1314781 RepID=A0A166BIX4_EXIGL|nr:N-acetylhexosaminidase [Exidia glandulosa HHB12029]
MVRISSSLVLVVALVSAPCRAVWPNPKAMTTGSTFLQLSPSFTINLAVTSPPSDLTAAVARTKGFLATDKLERLVPGRGSADSAKITAAKQLARLTVSLASGSAVTSISSEAVKALGSRVEAYNLTVPADGSDATLKAQTSLGLLRGLTTFEQLWHTLGNATYTTSAPIAIQDAPAFPYRGFMLDTARNFFPVADIKRTLDAMSWVKMNVLHWHVVDSQSFPLVIPGFEELSTQGAYSPTKIYSVADVQDITSYAAARGIDVIVEIDSPGHMSVISKSHPTLMACVEATPWSNFAAEPPAGQLRMASDDAISFANAMFKAAASIVPSKYFSTGGDEVNSNCYTQDTVTQAALKSKNLTFEQALSNFVSGTHKSLATAGKTPVVWEEMVLDHTITLPNTTVVLVWQSSTNAAAVAKKGFQLVHAPSDFFYLDCGAGEWLGNDIGNSWCDPFKTWQKMYSFQPFQNLTTAQHSLVLGGQNLLWAEQSDASNLDSIAWPRSAASAEIFWTGANQPNGVPRNSTEALPRLHDIRFRMVQRGVKAIALQPEYCALQPSKCT